MHLSWLVALGLGSTAVLLLAEGRADARVCASATSPHGLRRLAVSPDGSCLYHAVACSLVHAGRAVPDWAPGGPPRWAGNLRGVLARYTRRQRSRDAAGLLALIRGRHEPDDTVDHLLSRVERDCSLPTCDWGQFGEIALLARLAGVYIVVHIAFECHEPRWTTVISPAGVEVAVPPEELRRLTLRGRAVHILNVDGRHFDALVPARTN